MISWFGSACVRSAAYVSAVMLLSLMTGVMQLGLGLMKAGTITTFLGDSVVSGFTTGSAILIMCSQVLSQLHDIV